MPVTNLSSIIPESEIDQTIARDIETKAALNAHLTEIDPHPQYANQLRGDARYFQGVSLLFTVDLPAIGGGEMHKIFYTVPGVKVEDLCIVVPVGINLFTTAAWPFKFEGVVENNNATFNVGVYFHNIFSGPIDVAPFKIRIFIIKFS